MVKCYAVRAEIKDALNWQGIRASVFRNAEKYVAYYSVDQSRSIYYNGPDLQIEVLFETASEGYQFSTFLSQWHLDNPFAAAGLHISVVENLTEICIDRNNLRLVRFSHYAASDSGSPIQSLKEFPGDDSVLSGSGSDLNLSQASSNDPDSRYQSIEKPENFQMFGHFKCHIKPKSEFPHLHNTNNILFMSWMVHQMFDGTHTFNSAIPHMAIRPITEKDFEPLAAEQNPLIERYKVELELEFLNEMAASQICPLLKDDCKRTSPTSFRTSVYVKDPSFHVQCLKWKYEHTKKLWKKPAAESYSDISQDYLLSEQSHSLIC